ncbi:uncharacterized protein LOC102709368 [Oryza brachyantha]|uniref:Uncharacterized protein n=1 Tax=Oryza brachyantha TaxID=4533 RepID=J3M3U8_ORYBR|nr:uncharacterized protein LOC102709368 [Oryza brachyantha]
MDAGTDGAKKKKKKWEEGEPLPEEKLKTVLLCTAFVYKAMNGLGTLATIWATVVLLGGFSTLIKKQDFWYVTVIAFVQSIGILGGYEDPAHQMFLRAPQALIENKAVTALEQKMSWWRRRTTTTQQQQQQQKKRNHGRTSRRKQEEKTWTLCNIYGCRSRIGFAIRAIMWLAQVAAAGTFVALSWKRIRKQDYVDPEFIGQDDHQNITWSLNIFYYLVLAQGIIFISMMLIPLTECFKVLALRKYMLFEPSGRKILFLYTQNSYLEFIAGNVSAIVGMNLVTFAKNLAVSSTVDDQLLGVRAMDRILRSLEFGSLALRRLQASMEPDDLVKLLNMLGFVRTAIDQDIRGHAARVVLKLSPDLLVQSCPQILCLISSSLLSTSYNRVSKMDFDLIWFGLHILDKLTDNPDNCRQAKDDDSDLLSRIIDLTNLCGHGRGSTRSNDIISDSWIEQEFMPLLQKEDDIPPPLINKIDREIIAGMALNILSKLVAAPGAAGVCLREETSRNLQFLTNTGMILEHVHAARVISCLAVDKAARQDIGKLPEIIKNLKDCLLSKTWPYINITKVAAKLLLLEYSSEELLNQIQLFIEENRTVEDQSFSIPISAFIEELDLDQLLQSRRKTLVQTLDLEDLLSLPRVNHSAEAAKALILLTTECEQNVEAFLQQINSEQELNKIVKALSSEDEEKEKKRVLAHFEGRRSLRSETLHTVKKIIWAEDEEDTKSLHAKLLVNLRAYSGPKGFDMHLIDDALPKVFKVVIDATATLEDPSSSENLDHVKDDLWVKQGKVLESFIGLAVQICSSPNTTSDFSKALKDANLSVDTFVKNLKKILEAYKPPITDFPCIRIFTLELLTWMVEENSSYREIILQCGVYEELNEVARTARKLESFKLFHCGVGVPKDGTHGCISSFATKLQEKLRQSPNFKERYGCYGEHASSISVLIA